MKKSELNNLASGKIALVHDHLAQLGGAEKVLQALAEMYPSAPIYTLLYKKSNIDKFFRDIDIKASYIQKLPWGVKKYQWYLPMMPSAIESLNLSEYDTVISSASSFAKGVITNPHACHICYCHTPTRYLWHYSNQYINELKVPKIAKEIITFYISRVRQWDFSAAQRVDHFIANSRATQLRIEKYYHRKSAIIHPPVDTHKFKISENLKNYFLTGGRLTPYKRLDLTIMAFNKLNLPLKIFGDGPDFFRLKKIAGDNIEFVGRVSEKEKIDLLSNCQAFIHPQEEDFGIAAVEAMASGRPVIAYEKGGARETVIDGETGILFGEQNWEDLADAVLSYLYQKKYSFNPYAIKAHAQKFSSERFKREINLYVDIMKKTKI
ncbi:MAG: glycosyltransferase [bacterium]|nr:glycosyltransferase [bacterium]